MINPFHLRDYVIRPTLQQLGLWSLSAENLLIGTVFQESRGGHYLHQLGDGPAVGIYQIEPKTHDDVLINYVSYRSSLLERLESVCTSQDKHEQLATNLSYATAIARLVYYRKPDALPDAEDVEALANYWKEHYNTHLGKGTPDEFINNFPTEILG